MRGRIFFFLLKIYAIGMIGGAAFFGGRALNHFPKIEEKKMEKEICIYEARKISNAQYEIMRRVK